MELQDLRNDVKKKYYVLSIYFSDLGLLSSG